MIFVPTPELDSPAARALRMEGLEVEELRCGDAYAYGRYFSGLWDAGQPFVVVEWDVIPWPGALGLLLGCPEPWCTHRYPLSPGHLSRSFGIGKYVPTGPALEECHVPWQQLDGAVIPVLQERLSRHPHVHEPPVAHARRSTET